MNQALLYYAVYSWIL